MGITVVESIKNEDKKLEIAAVMFKHRYPALLGSPVVWIVEITGTRGTYPGQ